MSLASQDSQPGQLLPQIFVPVSWGLHDDATGFYKKYPVLLLWNMSFFWKLATSESSDSDADGFQVLVEL